MIKQKKYYMLALLMSSAFSCAMDKVDRVKDFSGGHYETVIELGPITVVRKVDPNAQPPVQEKRYVTSLEKCGLFVIDKKAKL
jgi:hypothetical protein